MCREGQQAETVPNTIAPLRKGGKRPDAADFPPLRRGRRLSPPCEGGVGGVRAAAHAMHLKAALICGTRAAMLSTATVSRRATGRSGRRLVESGCRLGGHATRPQIG